MKSKSIILPSYSAYLFPSQLRDSISFTSQTTKLLRNDETTWIKRKPKKEHKIKLENKSQQKAMNQEVVSLLQQNQNLKLQIKRLNGMLGIKKSLRGIERLKTEGNEDKKEETKRLKKIIEKSYYSIKEMQRQIQKLTLALKQKTSQINQFEYNCNTLKLQNQQLKNKLDRTISTHQSQISICFSKIQQLETQFKDIANLIEEDYTNWKQSQGQLLVSRKFYQKRTSS